MNDWTKEVQHEIDSMMGSKYAKYSDKQIESFEVSVSAGRLVGGRSRRKEIEQYSLDGVLLNEYDSLTAAAKSVNRSNKSLREAIQGKSKTCGGFIWKYKN